MKTLFKSMDFPRKVLSSVDALDYRVYKEDGTFVDVEAAMASEAMEKSGVINPVNVVRIGCSSTLKVLDVSELKDRPAEIPAEVAALAEEPQETTE